MGLKSRVVLSIIISMLLHISVSANSMPMVMEEDPTFSMAPMGSTDIAVVREYLEFDMREGQGNTAKVTASYEMKNTSKESIEQMMLFPFITAYRKGFLSRVKITADDKPVAFKDFRLRDIPNNNYNESTYDYFHKDLAPIVAIDSIVAMLNIKEYTPNYFQLNETINVYTLPLPAKEEAYRGEISFKIDPQKHNLLAYNYNGLTLNIDGSGILSMWVASKEIRPDGEKIYIALLGEEGENRASFETSGEQGFTVEEKTLEGFLKEDIIPSKLWENRLEDEEKLYDYTIKQLDRILSSNPYFIALEEDVLSPFFHNTYIGALLYEVEFPPEGSVNVTVEYEVEATRDRRSTRDFTDMFLYLLQPAAGWKDFEYLTIRVIPNGAKPFIIESSLPLTKDEATGIYHGEFQGLPEKDFYFTTYKTNQPEPPLPKLIRNGPYLLFFLAPLLFGMIIVGGAVTMIMNIRKKRNH